jgi:hypothetical protein
VARGRLETRIRAPAAQLDGLRSFIGLRWEDPETVRVTIRRG